ncbi:MAG: AAA family ATPase [Cytophagales bacterium]|nr:AAA family ATPase [Rhizobacter sp.]
MYAKFFGLKQEPFSISPDPRYLYMSERHREALAHLLYGVRGGGGVVLLTGEIGAGKTTVCRCFLEQIPKRCNVAYIFNPKLTVVELLKTVCDEFHIPLDPNRHHSETVKEYLDPINEFLLKTHAVGQNNVLIIDEAQNLSSDVLEQLRLLTNLETNERKLLQIILIGQPELRDMLARPELEQLAQRVTARYHLKALSQAETMQYIRHRLGVAGLNGVVPFEREARKRIHQLSRGVPRRINLLCDRALLGAYASSRDRVDRDTVDKAAVEVFGENDVVAMPSPRMTRVVALACGVGVLVGLALFGVINWATESGTRRQVAVVTPAADAAEAAGVTVLAASRPAVAALTASPAAALKLSLRNENDAWRELGAWWKAPLGPGDPCQAAQQQQLQCFKSDGGLALMRQLARPSVLTLYDDDGKPAYAVLVGLTSQSASLRAGGSTQTVPLLSLTRQWRGEFATFWRVPSGYQNRLQSGQTGPAVDWVVAQLAKAHGEASPVGGQKFDTAVQSKVTSFQLAQGLRPDGKVGPVTVMQLNRVAGVDEPRLQADTASN